ncbi:hypothetical protein [Synechococcus sp. PROS-U-1]|nr:hypothetical protein [Synechococcus sp. PROS-U-1]QNJ02554.1 hypothetical protein SynPROSU1_00943 [Synechococcus sp. PROS-U-1]
MINTADTIAKQRSIELRRKERDRGENRTSYPHCNGLSPFTSNGDFSA